MKLMLVGFGLTVAFVLANLAAASIYADLRSVIMGDSDLYYRTKPRSRAYTISTLFHDGRIVRYDIGEHGERVVDHEQASEYGGRIILCVGDSNTFGHDAEGDETYPHQLGQRLGRGFTVLNFGLSSYTTHQAAIQLRRKMARFPPDLVIWQLDENDDDPILPAGLAVNSWFFSSSPLGLVLFNFLADERIGIVDQVEVPSAAVTLEAAARMLKRRGIPVIFSYETVPPSLKGGKLEAIVRRSGLRAEFYTMSYMERYQLA